MERRPLVIYDADCGFCRRWIARWRDQTGSAVRYAPFQRPGLLLAHGIPRARARRAMQLVDRNGRVYQGSRAVFRALSHAPGQRWLRWVPRVPVVAQLLELGYRLVASHRTAAARLDRWLIGTPGAVHYVRTRRAFFASLGAVYLAAFTSLRAQVLGLYGSEGITPIGRLLDALRAAPLPPHRKYAMAPTLLWRDASDENLERLCALGQLASAAMAFGVAPRATAALCWALYLSFVTVGEDFLSFQWDALLLESGLHAMILAPTRPDGRDEPARWQLALARALVFRLYFESGLVKLRSPDRCWRACSAMRHYYETAPLPTRVGWWAHHLPARLQDASTAATLGVELGLPFLAFGPRRLRLVAFAGLTGFQALIAATGNYGFFNALAATLGLWLLDDEALPAARRPRRRERAPRRGVWRPLAAAAGAVVAAVGDAGLAAMFERAPRWLGALRRAIAPVQSVNTYGPFSVMTRERPEITVEGSDDGVEWRPYAFRYKVDAPDRAPRWVAPHQPRLDWQMWFAALSGVPQWFVAFATRLLQGSRPVVALLANDPFPDHPPRYVRARRANYRATTLAERRATGAWWRFEPAGRYLPAVALG